MDRGSETQPRVIENLNKLTWRDKGYFTTMSMKGVVCEEAANER